MKTKEEIWDKNHKHEPTHSFSVTAGRFVERQQSVESEREKGLRSMQEYHDQSHQWISVKDRLPEVAGNYLVCFFNPESNLKRLYSITSIWSRGKWYFDFMEKEKAEDHTLTITHWMPLPNPPKQD